MVAAKMTARIDLSIEFRRTQSVGPAMVYVLPHRGEEFLKLGFSRDPLQRMQNLHPRYFEFFDVDRAILIETTRVIEARRMESQFKSAAAEYRAPAPLDILHEAGGETEWYRGAYALLKGYAEIKERENFNVHWRAGEWIASQLLCRRDQLFEWAHAQFRALDAAGESSPYGKRIAKALRDALDANRYFSVDTTNAVPPDVADWYSSSIS
jgi:hypothetical protein